jgi:hypothetical protein
MDTTQPDAKLEGMGLFRNWVTFQPHQPGPNREAFRVMWSAWVNDDEPQNPRAGTAWPSTLLLQPRQAALVDWVPSKRAPRPDAASSSFGGLSVHQFAVTSQVLPSPEAISLTLEDCVLEDFELVDANLFNRTGFIYSDEEESYLAQFIYEE